MEWQPQHHSQPQPQPQLLPQPQPKCRTLAKVTPVTRTPSAWSLALVTTALVFPLLLRPASISSTPPALRLPANCPPEASTSVQTLQTRTTPSIMSSALSLTTLLLL